MEVIKVQGEVLMTKRYWWQLYKKVGVNIMIYGVDYGGLDLSGVKKKI